MNQHIKDFVKILESIKSSKNNYEVFNDWLIMSAAALYSWKKDQAVENEYMEIAKQYTKEDLEKHSQLLIIITNALEEKEQDFLGQIFFELNLTNARTGQFFTPYNISKMMAEMTIGDTVLPDNKLLRINEPCCGSGGMVIASIEVLKRHGFNYQQNAYFIVNDIDARCARMAYIQLSLLAAPAVIWCGNTLTLETYWQRETIGYFLADIDFRLQAEHMLEIIKNPEQPEAEPVQEKIPVEISLPTASERKLVQGELF